MSKNSKKDLNPKKESWLEHMKRMGYTKEQAYGLDLCPEPEPILCQDSKEPDDFNGY